MDWRKDVMDLLLLVLIPTLTVIFTWTWTVNNVNIGVSFISCFVFLLGASKVFRDTLISGWFITIINPPRGWPPGPQGGELKGTLFTGPHPLPLEANLLAIKEENSKGPSLQAPYRLRHKSRPKFWSQAIKEENSKGITLNSHIPLTPRGRPSRPKRRELKGALFTGMCTPSP